MNIQNKNQPQYKFIPYGYAHTDEQNWNWSFNKKTNNIGNTLWLLSLLLIPSIIFLLKM